MNPKNMRRLITETLEKIDHYYTITKTDINLIEMTFLMESDMNNLFSEGHIDKRGMFMVSNAMLEDIILNVIKPSKKAKENILKVSLVDIDADSQEDLFDSAAYNIAFQISVLFYFYFTKLNDMPMDISQCADAYYTHWKRHDLISGTQRNAAIKAFIEYDKEAKRS